MSGKLLHFPGGQERKTPTQPESLEKKTLSDTIERTHAVIELTPFRGVYFDRLPDSPRVRKFFTTLREKRVLYVLQATDGDLLASDMVCVLTFHETDEVPEKISLSIADFYRYTAREPSTSPDFGNYILEYANTHRYMLEMEDEDPDDFDNIEQRNIKEVPNFFPEAIPMSDLDRDEGYDYEVIDPLIELHVSATSFVRDEEYIPPVLFLLIEAVHALDIEESEASLIQIARYGSGKNSSLIISLSHEELIDLIDSAILRSYPLIPSKHDTPEKRRLYIRERIVLSRLDPKNLGGGYIPKGEE